VGTVVREDPHAFEELIHRQTTSGMLLLGTAILALIMANSALAGFYEHLLHVPVGIQIGSWSLEKTLHHWINDVSWRCSSLWSGSS